MEGENPHATKPQPSDCLKTPLLTILLNFLTISYLSLKLFCSHLVYQ